MLVLVLYLGTTGKEETVRGFCFSSVFNGIGKIHINNLSPNGNFRQYCEAGLASTFKEGHAEVNA